MAKVKVNNEFSELDDLIGKTPKSSTPKKETPEIRKNSNEWLKTENKRLANEVSRLRKELVGKTQQLNAVAAPVGSVDSQVEKLFLVFFNNFRGNNKTKTPYKFIQMTHPTGTGILDEFVKTFPFLKKYSDKK